MVQTLPLAAMTGWAGFAARRGRGASEEVEEAEIGQPFEDHAVSWRTDHWLQSGWLDRGGREAGLVRPGEAAHCAAAVR